MNRGRIERQWRQLPEGYRIVDCYFIGDEEVTEEEFTRRFPPKPLEDGDEVMTDRPAAAWPMVSDALAVHATQVDAANARAKRHGIPVEYRKDGRCVIPDKAARKKIIRLEGFYPKSDFC